MIKHKLWSLQPYQSNHTKQVQNYVPSKYIASEKQVYLYVWILQLLLKQILTYWVPTPWAVVPSLPKQVYHNAQCIHQRYIQTYFADSGTKNLPESKHYKCCHDGLLNTVEGYHVLPDVSCTQSNFLHLKPVEQVCQKDEHVLPQVIVGV